MLEAAAEPVCVSGGSGTVGRVGDVQQRAAVRFGVHVRLQCRVCAVWGQRAPVSGDVSVGRQCTNVRRDDGDGHSIDDALGQQCVRRIIGDAGVRRPRGRRSRRRSST